MKKVKVGIVWEVTEDVMLQVPDDLDLEDDDTVKEYIRNNIDHVEQLRRFVGLPLGPSTYLYNEQEL